MSWLDSGCQKQPGQPSTVPSSSWMCLGIVIPLDEVRGNVDPVIDLDGYPLDLDVRLTLAVSCPVDSGLGYRPCPDLGSVPDPGRVRSRLAGNPVDVQRLNGLRLRLLHE